MIRALLILVLLAMTAHADPSAQARADALFDRGQAAYTAGNYREAVPLFKDAYELVHDPVYLFNLAQTYRKLLDCESAFDFYTQYLAAAQDADARQREKVQQWLRELSPCAESRKHEHAVAAENAEILRRQREAEAQKRRQAAAPPPRTPADPGRPYRVGGLAGVVVGAVGLVVGITYSAKGHALKSDLATLCATKCNWDDPAIQAKDADGHHANTVAAIGWIGGGVAVAGGVALYLLGRTKIEHVTIAPTAGGASVGASFAF